MRSFASCCDAVGLTGVGNSGGTLPDHYVARFDARRLELQGLDRHEAGGERGSDQDERMEVFRF